MELFGRLARRQPVWASRKHFGRLFAVMLVFKGVAVLATLTIVSSPNVWVPAYAQVPTVGLGLPGRGDASRRRRAGWLLARAVGGLQAVRLTTWGMAGAVRRGPRRGHRARPRCRARHATGERGVGVILFSLGVNRRAQAYPPPHRPSEPTRISPRRPNPRLTHPVAAGIPPHHPPLPRSPHRRREIARGRHRQPSRPPRPGRFPAPPPPLFPPLLVPRHRAGRVGRITSPRRLP